ncbi:MFS transporter [Streptomyces rochei]|uniref:MFS transporter n=1 Tax=Streptomyces rochei TaxID=1928 RepID=UPI0013B7EF1C|nr:MFS transporter [Streptomyces rochei]NEC76179.1 MFS transporter [Streptomyces rochei]
MTNAISRGRGLIAVMILIVVCSGVVQGYLTPLLPVVGAHVGLGGVGQNNLYLLSQIAFTVLTPLLSRWGDMWGHRRLLLVAVTMVAAGSLLIAARPTAATLAVGMVLQSAVVGFFPLLAGILRSRSPEHGRIGMSVLVGALLLSIGTGGFVAGTLSDQHALAGLWTAVPFGALAVVAAIALPASTAPRAGRFNLAAALLLTCGLGVLMLGLTEGDSWGWTSAPSLLAAVAAVVLLAAWARVEQRSSHPLVDLRMLRDPRLAAVSAHTFCVAFGAIGFLGANAVYLGTEPDSDGFGLGLGAQAISLVSLAMVAVGFVGSTMTPWLARLIGDRAVLAAGGCAGAAGFLSLVLFHSSVPQYLAGALVVGLATGMFEAATRTLSVEVVDEADTALSVGVNEMALSLGAAIGAAVIGALWSSHTTAQGAVTGTGYQWAWAACAAVALGGAAVALFFRSPSAAPEAALDPAGRTA